MMMMMNKKQKSKQFTNYKEKNKENMAMNEQNGTYSEKGLGFIMTANTKLNN